MNTDHHNHVRCQSCGMPFDGAEAKSNLYGTNADESVNEEYCSFCYQKGAFTEPALTLEGMIKKSVRQMMNHESLEEEQAEVLANAMIPPLKRWRK